MQIRIYIFNRTRSFWGCLQNTKDQLQYLYSYSGSPRLSDKRPSRSPGPFSPLDGRRIANVIIAKNLNETHQQVQIQALEVFQPSDSSFTSWSGSLDADNSDSSFAAGAYFHERRFMPPQSHFCLLLSLHLNLAHVWRLIWQVSLPHHM